MNYYDRYYWLLPGNWAYYDGYGDNEVGRFGAGFSLILLSKYGHKPRRILSTLKSILKHFRNC
jgi:hypothetical protein